MIKISEQKGERRVAAGHHHHHRSHRPDLREGGPDPAR